MIILKTEKVSDARSLSGEIGQHSKELYAFLILMFISLLAMEDDKRSSGMLSSKLCIKSVTDNVDVVEFSQIANENLPFPVEDDIICSNPGCLSLAQQHVKQQRTYHYEQGLPSFTDINYLKDDLSFISNSWQLLSSWELWEIERSVKNAAFCNWMTSTKSEHFIFGWNCNQHSPVSGVLSPISMFSASLAALLNNHDQFICGVWFVSRHVELGNDGISVMLANLIDQICQQYSFDFERLGHGGVSGARLENRGNEELFNLMYALIKQLPSDKTLVLMIDEASSFYHNKKFKDGPYIIDRLEKLEHDESLSTIVKLFSTRTNRIKCRRRT